jgi:hypothetical protein
MNEEEFNGKSAATGLLNKVHETKKYWAEVYKAIGKPFELRSPTPEELEAYVRKLAKSYKKKK